MQDRNIESTEKSVTSVDHPEKVIHDILASLPHHNFELNHEETNRMVKFFIHTLKFNVTEFENYYQKEVFYSHSPTSHFSIALTVAIPEANDDGPQDICEMTLCIDNTHSGDKPFGEKKYIPDTQEIENLRLELASIHAKVITEGFKEAPNLFNPDTLITDEK